MSCSSLSTVELLRRLVKFDSVSRNSNLPIADFLCDVLDRPGIRLTRIPNTDGDKVNLIAEIGPPPDECGGRAGLVLSGHLDVVPADEPDWRTDPFMLTETDDAYVGRGACDMKGFVAQAVNLVSRCADDSLARPLVLILTYDEEVGTVGAAHLSRTIPHPDSLPRAAIVGEPTELRVVRMHKGHTKMRITLHGRSAHSGYPHLGLNAIEPAGPVIEALAALRQSLQSERNESSPLFPETPFPVLNVATIRGGTAINMVPDRCVVEFGVRLLPGMDAGAVVDRLQATLEDVQGLGEHTFELINDSPALNTRADAPVHRALCEVVGQTESHGVSYASDAGWLQHLGMDCVLFGAGSIETAHRANESMPKDQFERAGEILERMVQLFCMK